MALSKYWKSPQNVGWALQAIWNAKINVFCPPQSVFNVKERLIWWAKSYSEKR